MTKLYALASYNARIVMVSSVFGIRGMFQINANPNKHDGLNDVEQIGVKERDYYFFSKINKNHIILSNLAYKISMTFNFTDLTLQFIN